MLLNIPDNHMVSEHNSLDRLAHGLGDLLAGSDHSYEHTVNRLLEALLEYSAEGVIEPCEYHAILGMAADVLHYFNYDLEMLTAESNHWYRASVVHQIGCGMLQVLERLRPDLTDDAIFSDAVQGLRIGRSAIAPSQLTRAMVPLSCKQWASQPPRRRKMPWLRLVVS